MDLETGNEIALLRAKYLGLREIIAMLVASEAKRSGDPDLFLRDMLEYIDTKLSNVARNMSQPSMPLEEATRKEADWL